MATFPKPEKAKTKPKQIVVSNQPGGPFTPGAKELEAKLAKARAQRDRAVNNKRSR
jgi:hypothetical protein